MKRKSIKHIQSEIKLRENRINKIQMEIEELKNDASCVNSAVGGEK